MSMTETQEPNPRGGLKTFRCGDVVPDCRAELEGVEASSIALASAHAVREHGVEPDEELLEAVRRGMRPA